MRPWKDDALWKEGILKHELRRVKAIDDELTVLKARLHELSVIRNGICSRASARARAMRAKEAA